MERDLTWRRRFVAAFNPYRDLTPDECETLYVAREGQPARRLVEALEDGEPERTRIALVGARGSGKSTELRQAMHLLAKPGAARLPVFVDIGEGLPAHATTAAWVPVVAAAVRAAREDWNGQPPEGDALPAALAAIGVGGDLLASLLTAVRAIGPWFGPQGVAVAAAAAPAGLAVSALGKAARAAQSGGGDRGALEALVDALRGEVQALAAAAGRPAALFIDGLDRRPSVEEVFQALNYYSRKSARQARIFASSSSRAAGARANRARGGGSVSDAGGGSLPLQKKASCPKSWRHSRTSQARRRHRWPEMAHLPPAVSRPGVPRRHRWPEMVHLPPAVSRPGVPRRHRWPEMVHLPPAVSRPGVPRRHRWPEM
ncbi:MAG: hypothetical protein ABIO70_12070, partial [Pseudomonadota bacterium]